MRSEFVIPSNGRILRSVRSTIAEVLHGEPLSEATRLRLSAADEALNELLLRTDGAYYVDYARRCVALGHRGKALLYDETDRDPLWDKLSNLPGLGEQAENFDTASSVIRAAWACLARMVQIALQDSRADRRAFADEAVALELSFHQHRQTQSMSAEELALPWRSNLNQEVFQNYLRGKFQDPGIEVTEFRELTGGFQKTTVLFALRFSNGRTDNLVMRLEKQHEKYVMLDAGTVAAEFDIVRFVHDHKIPSAEPRWLENDSAPMGAPFMVVSHVPGQSIKVTGIDATLLTPGERLTEAALRSVVETLAAIHALPLSPLAGTALSHGVGGTLAENTRAAVESWANQRWSNDMMSSPTIERCFDWLRKNVPEADDRLSLVHVDYGFHNILVAEERVSAVLDWESARIGDPAEDIAYLLQSLGPTANREKVIGWYEAASGRRISEERLRYFEVYNALKVSLAGCHSAALFEQDARVGMEWCSLALFVFLYGASSLQEKIASA